MEDSPTLGWELCPEELLWMIFRKLNYQSLLSCMTVNRRWKYIVLDYIEFYFLWPRIFAVTMINGGRTFKRKSVLSLKDMWVNSMLWPSVRLAEIKLNYTYAVQNITCIHVYKDKLILTTDVEREKHIKYFNITNSELIKSVDGAVKTTEFRENDYMFVYFGPIFRAYGKESPDDTRHDENRMIGYGIDNILLYKLEDNVCYIFINTFYITFALTWDKKKWNLESRGRYYGNDYDSVCGMNVFNDRVCLVTKLGFVLCEDLETKTYHKVNRCNLVPRLQESTVLELFSPDRVAVSVSDNNKQRVTVSLELRTNFVWLQCENLTCLTEHGKILFLGFKDGGVGVYTPPVHHSDSGQMNRLFKVQDYDSSIQNPSICKIEVFEDYLSHHLLVVTQDKVLQVFFTYPEHVTTYYE